jgi:hypothetical protein
MLVLCVLVGGALCSAPRAPGVGSSSDTKAASAIHTVCHRRDHDGGAWPGDDDNVRLLCQQLQHVLDALDRIGGAQTQLRGGTNASLAPPSASAPPLPSPSPPSHLPPDPWFGPGAPGQVHLAMTASRDTYKVIWQTNSSFSRPINTTMGNGHFEWCPAGPGCPAAPSELPYVRFGTSPTNLSLSSSGIKKTYRRVDMCGYPAAALAGDPRLAIRTGDGVQQAGWEEPGTFYEADMVGLQPGVVYFYSVGDQWNGFTPVRSFRCSDADERGEARWLHYGDMGTVGSAPGGDAVRDAIVAHEMVVHDALNPASTAMPAWDMVLHIGDIAYAFGHEHIWRNWASAVEPIASRIPYMVGCGNHEIQAGVMGGSAGACAVPYLARFSMPAENAGRRGTANFWWKLRLGPVLVITMSTEHNYTAGSEQHAWLVETLGSIDRSLTPWVVRQAFPSMMRSILTEIYLCHACSCQEILRVETRPGRC